MQEEDETTRANVFKKPAAEESDQGRGDQSLQHHRIGRHRPVGLSDRSAAAGHDHNYLRAGPAGSAGRGRYHG